MKNSGLLVGREVPQSVHLFGHSGASGGCCLLSSRRSGEALAASRRFAPSDGLTLLVHAAGVLDGHFDAVEVCCLFRENDFDLECFGEIRISAGGKRDPPGWCRDGTPVRAIRDRSGALSASRPRQRSFCNRGSCSRLRRTRRPRRRSVPPRPEKQWSRMHPSGCPPASRAAPLPYRADGGCPAGASVSQSARRRSRLS